MKKEFEYLLKNANYSNLSKEEFDKLNLKEQFDEYDKLINHIKEMSEHSQINENIYKMKKDYFIVNPRATVHFIHDKN